VPIRVAVLAKPPSRQSKLFLLVMEFLKDAVYIPLVPTALKSRKCGLHEPCSMQREHAYLDLERDGL
jgi:hypothetical protein